MDVRASFTVQRGASPARATPERDGVTAVFAHPSKPLLVLVVDNAVVLFDPATGGSAMLSSRARPGKVRRGRVLVPA